MDAKYTMLFSTWLDKVQEGEQYSYGSRLTSYFSDSVFTNDMASDLTSMLTAIYRYYECGTEDYDEMLQYLTDTFDEYKDYYYELITNYQKEYNYELNNKRVITKSDSLSMVGNTKVDNDTNNKQTEYELPNKVINESYRSTPSTIIDTDSKNTNNKDYTNDTTRDSVTTTEFNNEFVDLKNKYINQIRNVYREFAMKFKECFYQVY